MPPAPSIREAPCRSILSPASGFIAQAGFTHTLSPARNCTYACSYCYVPTMRIQAGLQPEDWQRWGQFTTFKTNAPALLPPALRPTQIIYCSPLVDPYQPAEAQRALMPAILRAIIESPPRIFVIQTRGPLILRDVPLLQELSRLATLRVSFSLTTDREEIRRLYEPLCAPHPERLATIRALRESGVETWATLAPILPCDPEALVHQAIAATHRDLIADPLHTRATKARGATTRDAALRISQHHNLTEWHHPAFQQGIVERMSAAARALHHRIVTGPPGFALLSQGTYGPCDKPKNCMHPGADARADASTSPRGPTTMKNGSEGTNFPQQHGKDTPS